MRKSKTELNKPKTIIKRLIKPRSQRCGVWMLMSSTRSVAMAISGKSVSRLVSKICLGSKGKNWRNSEAPAMLNMLPKLALVAIKIYFMVLVKVLRPSTIPLISTSRFWLNKTISAASLATSTAYQQKSRHQRCVKPGHR